MGMGGNSDDVLCSVYWLLPGFTEAESTSVCTVSSKLRQGSNRIWKEIAIKRMPVNSRSVL